MISDIASGIIIDKITHDNLDIKLGEEKFEYEHYPTVNICLRENIASQKID